LDLIAGVVFLHHGAAPLPGDSEDSEPSQIGVYIGGVFFEWMLRPMDLNVLQKIEEFMQPNGFECPANGGTDSSMRPMEFE